MVPSFPALKCLFISYYAPLSFKTQVELTGAKHIPFPEVTECYSGPFMGREDFLAVIPLVFLGQAKEAIDDIMKGLMADRPDVIISDALALAGRLAAWKMDLPLVMMFTSYAPGKNFSIFRTLMMMATTTERSVRCLTTTEEISITSRLTNCWATTGWVVRLTNWRKEPKCTSAI